jgi:hypothetical protein
MRSNPVPGRDAVIAAVHDYRTAVATLAALPPAALDALDMPELCGVLDTMETRRCQTPVIEHAAINALAAAATPEQIGGSLKKYLADRLRIRPAEARRRIAAAETLGARRALTGEPLEPMWAGAAAGQRAGQINTDHIGEIGRFFSQLPGWVDQQSREYTEATLAHHAGGSLLVLPLSYWRIVCRIGSAAIL